MRNHYRTTWPTLAACLGCACSGAAVLAASEAVAQPAPAPIIAVFDIEAKGVDLSPQVLDILADYLATRLAESRRYQVVPRPEVKSRLAEAQNEAYKKCYDESCQIEMGRDLAANKSLATRIAALGSQCTVNLNVFDLERKVSGEAATAVGACSQDGIVTSLKSAVERLTGTGGGTGPIEGVKLDRGETIVNEPTDRFGFLFVRTEPPGATVFVNGQEKGPSPQQLELPEGRYVVVAEMGRLHHPARQEVALTTEGVRLVLELAPAWGTLEVTSDPGGAEVWLDREKVGETPLRLDRKPSGTYRLRVQAPDFVAEERDVVVADGQASVHHVELAPDWGELSVESSPQGAAIVLDDTATGHVTPHWFQRVRPGVHIVRLSLAGHGDRAEKANVERGAVASVRANLDPMLGTLVVTSEYSDGMPCEGNLTIDGAVVGLAPWRGQVLAVEHEVAVSCPGGSGRLVTLVRHNRRTDAVVKVSGRAPDEEERVVPPDPVAGEPGPVPDPGPVVSPVVRERVVRVPLTLSVAEGFLRYGGDTRRTHVGMGLDVGLRFRGAQWLVPGLGLWWTVESPVAVTLRPGIQWCFGKFPMYVRTALAAMLTPERTVGFHVGLGGDVPLWKGGFLALEATTTVWSVRLFPMEFRVGIGHAF